MSERDPDQVRVRRIALAMRVGALAPLLAGLVAYLLWEGFRTALGDGVTLLWAGDREGLVAWARELGPWAPLATSVLMVVQALAAPIPAVLITAANSLLFGPFLGGLLSIGSATVAAALCFALGRSLGRPLVAYTLPPRTLARADALVQRHGVLAVLVARLVPVVPFDPISYVAGLSSMRLVPFLVATLVGQAPAGMAYSYLAQEIDRPLRLLVLALGTFTALLVLGLAARRLLLREPEDAAS